MNTISLTAAVERATGPLDRCRRVGLRWISRSQLALNTFVDRDRRIATLACANVALAAVGAIYAPVLLFTLGPILLGVAHVASDVRYLVLRRQLARWWQNVVWLGCLALIALRALEELGVLHQVERLELGVAVAFVAVALVAAIRGHGSWLRAGLTASLLVVAAGLAWRHPSEARLVFLHLHNLIALLAWGLLFRAGKRWLLVPASLITATTLLLVGGIVYEQTLASSFASTFRLHVLSVADWVAPFASLRTAVGVTSAYVFLQSIHYSVWLSWIPQEEQPLRGTPTYRMSARSLFADLGPKGVLALAIAAGAVLLGACFELHRTRALYLSLATFHGYLELALLGFFWVRGTGLDKKAADEISENQPVAPKSGDERVVPIGASLAEVLTQATRVFPREIGAGAAAKRTHTVVALCAGTAQPRGQRRQISETRTSKRHPPHPN